MKKANKKSDVSRRGPKADRGKVRDAILTAARSEFGKHGFDGATVRAIAREAEVDVALVPYYFGSKADLFVAALALPVNPADVLTSILEQGLGGAGERVLRVLLNVWDQPQTGAPLIAMLRSLSTQAKFLRQFIEVQLVATLAAAIDAPDAQIRAAAFTSQILGLVLERYVLEIEPIAEADHDEIVALLAPTLQNYIDGGNP